MKQELLLESYLRDLRLSRFVVSYQSLAQEAARTNLSYERYLLALVSEEVAHRQAGRIERAIGEAHFPVLKDLAEFDWSCLPSGLKPRILEARWRGLYRPPRASDPGWQSWSGKESYRLRTGPGGLSTRATRALLQCRWARQ
jgi:hypothetical protein